MSRSFPELVIGDSSSPWMGAAFRDATAARAAMDQANRLTTALWPGFVAALERVKGSNAVQPPRTLADARRLIVTCRQVAQVLATYPADVFLQDLPAGRHDACARGWCVFQQCGLH